MNSSDENECLFLTSNFLSHSIQWFIIVFNALNVIILNDKSLKHRFYKYLQCKSSIDMFICGLGGLYQRRNFIKFPLDDFIVALVFRILLVTSAFSECYLVLNRYFSVSLNHEKFRKLPFKYYISFIFGFPLLLFCTPLYFFSLNKMLTMSLL